MNRSLSISCNEVPFVASSATLPVRFFSSGLQDCAASHGILSSFQWKRGGNKMKKGKGQQSQETGQLKCLFKKLILEATPGDVCLHLFPQNGVTWLVSLVMGFSIRKELWRHFNVSKLGLLFKNIYIIKLFSHTEMLEEQYSENLHTHHLNSVNNMCYICFITDLSIIHSSIIQ